MDADDMINRFTFHPASPDQGRQYERIRQLALDYSAELVARCPDSRELSLAITRLEEAVFWANAAIARHS